MQRKVLNQITITNLNSHFRLLSSSFRGSRMICRAPVLSSFIVHITYPARLIGRFFTLFLGSSLNASLDL